MISNEKMEKLWWQYKNEGIAQNLSLQAFCSLHSVPYNAFEKYLKLRRHFSDVHHITVTDLPKQDSTPVPPQTETPAIRTAPKGKTGVRIKILIHMSNGVQVSKKNIGRGEGPSHRGTPQCNPVHDPRRDKADPVPHPRQA